MANVLLPLADPVEKSGAADDHARLPPSTLELHLLLPWQRRRSRREWTWIFSASVALHMLIFLLAVQLPGPTQTSEEQHTVTYKRIILYMPPSLMTQKAPNRKQVSKQIDLADLLASESSQARRATPAPSRRHFELPKQSLAPRPNAKNAQALPTAPQVALNQTPAQLPAGSPNSPLAPAPPPPAPAQNPFQDVGAAPAPNAHPTLAPPHSGVQAAINGARDANSRRVMITDDSQSQAAPGSPLAPAANGGPHTAVELQSDPQNADFRPYLARILAIVRANWRRVIPESARLGQLRGRTVIEFVIDRDGSIPKLVTADSSGYEPLDRAAVAGLSMSNPLPPLPADFKGFQVRLAFTFAYNMPSQ
jgi:TonB family protein